MNLYPFDPDSSTELLVALHLPVALWFAVAYPYMGGAWRSHERRMDFVRFTGEWFIYYVLIALGGGVLVGLTSGVLEPLEGRGRAIARWVVPCGAAGAVIVAAWLVEAKQSVVENMAPVLTMVFTPLFAVMLAALSRHLRRVGTGEFDRDRLVVFDALLIVVLALLLYGLSARQATARAGLMEAMQLVAVAGALILDVMVLGSMLARIGDLGFTPNRVAALGLNVVLLVNLVWAAWLSIRLLAGRVTFHRLERWPGIYPNVSGGEAAADRWSCRVLGACIMKDHIRDGAGDQPESNVLGPALIREQLAWRVPRWLDYAASLAWRSLLVLAALGVAIWVLAKIEVIVIATVVALMVAGVLTPAVDYLRRRVFRRAWLPCWPLVPWPSSSGF